MTLLDYGTRSGLTMTPMASMNPPHGSHGMSGISRTECKSIPTLVSSSIFRIRQFFPHDLKKFAPYSASHVWIFLHNVMLFCTSGLVRTTDDLNFLLTTVLGSSGHFTFSQYSRCTCSHIQCSFSDYSCCYRSCFPSLILGSSPGCFVQCRYCISHVVTLFAHV